MEINSVEHFAVISDDPSDWPLKLTDSIRILFIKKGLVQIKNFDFPKNLLNWKFSSAYYQHTFHNEEQLERSWLIRKKMIICTVSAVECLVPNYLIQEWSLNLVIMIGEICRVISKYTKHQKHMFFIFQIDKKWF
uniref:Zinc finger MYM-type protein 5 n=1 Tax=Sipha flava TaxID=143950 RepID=A0A2S2QIT3_9HEMI